MDHSAGPDLDPVPSCGPNGRVALIVPPANPVAEAEIADLVPRSVQFYVGRLAPVPSSDLLTRVRGYDEDLRRAVHQFGGLAVDATVLAFAAISFLRGRSQEEGLLDDLRAGTDRPAVTAADALVQRMTDLGRRRVVIVSPYPDRLDDLALKYWAESGLDVVEVVNIVPPGGSIYAINDENVARAVLARSVPDDAVIALCGTGMATAGQLWRIRRATGVPCVSYNSAIAWWLLREVGPFAAPGPVDAELSGEA